MKRISTNWKLTLLSFMWISAMVCGFSILMKYARTPGIAAINQEFAWPKESLIKKDLKKPTLLVFAHPYCPCSSASIGELERLMPSLINKVQVMVVFIQPKNRPRSWVQSSLWEKTKKIPGVQVMADYNYSEANFFGAQTSGQVFFYDSQGEKFFSGGITPARGHMGDSKGRDTILAFIEGQKVNREIASVFGCSLRDAKFESESM